MTDTGTDKTTQTPYERGWWYLFLALILCLVAMSVNLTTAHTPEPISMAWFLLTFAMSALLGVYSWVLLRRLPITMAAAGAIQGCLFGFNVLGRFLIAWVAKVTT